MVEFSDESSESGHKRSTFGECCHSVAPMKNEDIGGKMETPVRHTRGVKRRLNFDTNTQQRKYQPRQQQCQQQQQQKYQPRQQQKYQQRQQYQLQQQQQYLPQQQHQQNWRRKQLLLEVSYHLCKTGFKTVSVGLDVENDFFVCIRIAGNNSGGVSLSTEEWERLLELKEAIFSYLLNEEDDVEFLPVELSERYTLKFGKWYNNKVIQFEEISGKIELTMTLTTWKELARISDCIFKIVKEYMKLQSRTSEYFGECISFCTQMIQTECTGCTESKKNHKCCDELYVKNKIERYTLPSIESNGEWSYERIKFELELFHHDVIAKYVISELSSDR